MTVDVDPVELVPDECVAAGDCAVAALDPLEAPHPVRISPPAVASTVIAIAGRHESFFMLLQPQIMAWRDAAAVPPVDGDERDAKPPGQLFLAQPEAVAQISQPLANRIRTARLAHGPQPTGFLPRVYSNR